MSRAWQRLNLSGINDAVITADAGGGVTSMNATAEALTGWTLADARGIPQATVYRLIDEASREPVEGPAERALREGIAVGLANHVLLVARDGSERPVDDSASLIRDASGAITAIVLAFWDCSGLPRHERAMHEALAFAEEILATLREPFLVLDRHLRVLRANAAFYRSFGVSDDATVGRFIYELGNGQWDIPALRTASSTTC